MKAGRAIDTTYGGHGERNRQATLLQMRRRRDEKRACATAESSLYKLHASTGARLRANSRRVRTLPLAGYDESSDAYLTAKQDPLAVRRS